MQILGMNENKTYFQKKPMAVGCVWVNTKSVICYCPTNSLTKIARKLLFLRNVGYGYGNIILLIKSFVS